MQRILDIFFSGLALLILSPLLIPFIVILKFTGEGEVFFLQKRVGKGGRQFNIYKFATMLKDSPNMSTGTLTVHNDPRILPLGGFLRNTKINELPQLVNIFLGDMSVIGPRPQTQRCFDAFPKSAQLAIIKVRPGLSGIGSIVFRNEEKMMHDNNDPDRIYNDIVMPFKGILEEWYVDNQSIWSYFGLIGLTIWVVAFSNSLVVWKIFKDLPRAPEKLRSWL